MSSLLFERIFSFFFHVTFSAVVSLSIVPYSHCKNKESLTRYGKESWFDTLLFDKYGIVHFRVGLDFYLANVGPLITIFFLNSEIQYCFGPGVGR